MLIERDKVIDLIARFYGSTPSNLLDDINKIPPGVLYCRDCRYWNKNEAYGKYHPCYRGGYFKEDGYCSRGERKEK